MNQMDVDLSSSSLKRPADISSTSSSADKRPKILPDEQMTTLSSKMNAIARRRKWESSVDDADVSDVLRDLTENLASTDMRDSVITKLTFEGADDIVKSFNEDQLEAWKVGVRNSVKSKDWTDLVARPELKIATFELSPEQENATKKSWVRPYHGRAADALWTHIRKHYRPSDAKEFHVHFCSVFQSSGMGKSRTIGKKHFSIPINLRDAKSDGYPPADHEVRDFLTMKGTEAESYRRACHFIDALFQHTNYTLENEFDPQLGIEEVACEFRMRMTEGQTMKWHNEFRRQFYQQVIQIAKGKPTVAQPGSDIGPGYLSPSTSGNAIDYDSSQHYDFPPAASCNKLVQSLKEREPLSCQVSGKTEGDYPLVILTFDEAHTLTNREETAWSNFSVLRHVLRTLYPLPLFTLFMSTTDRISQFTSPDKDTSTRIILPSSPGLERVTHDSHIVHMGRPLFGSRWDAGDVTVQAGIVTFAVGKLLNANPSTQHLNADQMLACLSQRLPIEFNSTTYISQSAERKQVEGHMRVCLNIDAGFQSMTTVSSSEPLLSEAAYVIMLLAFQLATDAQYITDSSTLHPSCTECLFKSLSAPGLEKLQDDFPDAKMHFNHFVKLHDFKSIDKETLLLLMTRGAGVLCANSQASIDAVTVFLKSGTTLTTDNFGLILCQFKNNPAYSKNPQSKLFESMDPLRP
ncbi:hypothetical protein F5887DRAFT_1232790 [Amanita rubescens]|nr:hypothetical protein F5887DRAFT_1232790 [Amanita rubescens]